MSNLHESKKILEMIQALGIYISIDDFGTGYSSLGQLKNNLPINMLKIDKSFMQNVLSKRNDSMIAKAIIDIARNLDLEVIAEGVEQKEQVDFLIDNGCYLAQGFHFSRPLEAEKIKQLLYFPDSNQSKEIH